MRSRRPGLTEAIADRRSKSGGDARRSANTRRSMRGHEAPLPRRATRCNKTTIWRLRPAEELKKGRSSVAGDGEGPAGNSLQRAAVSDRGHPHGRLGITLAIHLRVRSGPRPDHGGGEATSPHGCANPRTPITEGPRTAMVWSSDKPSAHGRAPSAARSSNSGV
jgi:hypothetical protein